LKPTEYVAVVLAKIGDGLTVTPVTDVPKVMLLASVVPANATWLVPLGTLVTGLVCCGTIVMGYEPAVEGLRPSAVTVMFASEGIPVARRTVTALLVPPTVVELGVADTTVSVVRVPPDGVYVTEYPAPLVLPYQPTLLAVVGMTLTGDVTTRLEMEYVVPATVRFAVFQGAAGSVPSPAIV
jgi:hypothetical protein